MSEYDVEAELRKARAAAEDYGAYFQAPGDAALTLDQLRTEFERALLASWERLLVAVGCSYGMTCDEMLRTGMRVTDDLVKPGRERTAADSCGRCRLLAAVRARMEAE